jgi:SPP1 family predicted phage head-tail adaptor
MVMRMAKYANPGALRTPVRFIRIDRTNDADGYPTETEVDVFGAPVMCAWVNVHGNEVFTAMQMKLREPATLTTRYSPLINQKLLIYKGTDPDPYEVISIDDVEDRHAWLEIKVQRATEAV